MITFDELAALSLRRVVPKEAERCAISLQMAASSSQEKMHLYHGVVGGIVQGIPCFATQFQRAHLSTKRAGGGLVAVLLVIRTGVHRAPVLGLRFIGLRFIGLRCTKTVSAGGVYAGYEEFLQ
jgi:hypothetical protein